MIVYLLEHVYLWDYFSRPATPQTVPTMNTRRQPPSTVEQSPTVAKSNRRTTGGQQAPPPPPTTTTTPKRGRKSTKLAEQSPEKESSATDRPVRIALSSHLVNKHNHFLPSSNRLLSEFRSEIHRYPTEIGFRNHGRILSRRCSCC